jgi:hypothetical protein
MSEISKKQLKSLTTAGTLSNWQIALSLAFNGQREKPDPPKKRLAFERLNAHSLTMMEGTEKSSEHPPTQNRCGRPRLAIFDCGIRKYCALGPVRLEVVRYMTLCSLLGLAVSFIGL